MKKSFLLILLVLVFCINFNVVAAESYDHKAIENFIAYRIKYIHNVAYNTKVELTKYRVEEYVKSIIQWSDYYSRELGVNVDPLLVTAILETETNFVSRDDYDGGNSIGISSMKVQTAKWIADKLGVNYTKWRMLDATDLGIRFTVYYLALAHNRYSSNLHKVITSYNQGFDGIPIADEDQLYNNYLFKVLGRYKYYQKRISSYGSNASKYFSYKFSDLYQ
ncbi:hypothetical protein JCM16358_03120 [Halanaerocella petrolearia]